MELVSLPLDLTPDEQRPLWSLLKVRNYQLQASLLRAMPFIGDATALEILEPYINDPRVPQRLRAQAQQILPKLRQRMERLSERRVLLRAADDSGESTILLRAAEGQPEIPEDQLLRKSSEE